jgi:hypothetical protein
MIASLQGSALFDLGQAAHLGRTRKSDRRRTMKDLEAVASVPGVSAAVLGDLEGTFLGSLRTSDGETIAAEMGFVGSTLLEVGELLGLGRLATFSLSGRDQACLLVVRPRSLITALIAPPHSLGPVERAVDTAFQEWT